MIKAKKILTPILFLLFILAALCVGLFSSSDVKASAEAEDPKQVTLREFQYFNTLLEDSSNVALGAAKYGMLLRFDDVLSDNRSEINGGIQKINLIEEYGKNIFINDMPLDFYSDAEVCYYLEDYVWVYVPNMHLYRKISVNESFQFKDRIVQPFALYAAMENGFVYWTESSEDFLDTRTKELEFKSITYNNKGYKYFSPKNGLLLEFDQKDNNGEWLGTNLSLAETEKNGGLMKINLLGHSAVQNEILGDGASVGENILLDGVPLKDISGAEISYHSERFLWVYAPNMIDYAKLEIKGDTLFLESYLPKLTLYSNGNEWIEFDPNASRKDTTGTESVTFEGLEWNNSDFGHRDGKNGVLLKFSENLSKSVNEIEGGVRDVNKVTAAIGNRIKLDGTPLNAIDGAEISYHSEKFLWIYIPSDKLFNENGGFPCLTIDADTEFLNAILPAVTLYFDGSYWQSEQPNASDYSDNNFADVLQNNVSLEGKEGYAYTVLIFDDAFETAADSRPNFAQTGDAGYKITINGKTLNELYCEDDGIRCSFGEAYGKNAIYLLVRKSDLFPTEEYPVTTLTIEDGTRIMDKAVGVTLYLVDGVWSLVSAPSAPYGEDTDAPYIYYYGEDSYLVVAGDVAIDFSKMALAFDEAEGEIACRVEFSSGALTDGKWNRGTWQVKLIAADSQDNQAEKILSVTAINEEETYLSVYVNGTFSYRLRYGEKIQYDKSEELSAGEPQKADSATSYFVFDCWTFKGKPWDFENDVVTEDVWLSPSYKEYKHLFTVTVKDADSGATDVLTVEAGKVIDFADYEKEGYSLVAKLENTLVKRVTVNGDLLIELQYFPIEETTVDSVSDEAGCSGNVAVGLIGLSLALGVLLLKKRGKADV